jgi:Mn2+/Fe2+ NRAMP family transporter
MKALNFIDLIFQTLVLGLVVLGCLAIVFSGSIESIGIVALYGGVFIGPWQLVSSFVTTLSKGLYLRWRVIHLVSSVCYIAIVSLVAAFLGDMDWDGVLKLVGGVLGFGIPVTLALFYYIITVKSFQLARAKKA